MMEEDPGPSKAEAKPFSVLEKFRQLKKEKEQVGTSVPAQTQDITNTPKTPDKSKTEFQASSGSQPSQRNGELGNHEGHCRGRPWRKRNFNESTNKRVAAEFHQGQSEQECGITEYIRKGLGFDAIIKHRYTDFHVNEIDKAGNVVKLTSTEIPKQEEESETFSTEEDPTLLPPEKWNQLKDIVEKESEDFISVDVTEMEKEHRQRLHKAVKRRFGARIFSNTIAVENRKVMQIGYSSNNKNYRYCAWPKDRPEYLHFVLYKENCEMNEAVGIVGKFTRTKPNKFGYAGTKDKRAITTQNICVRRCDVSRFKDCYKLRGIAVGNYKYKWSNLRLGDLQGNRFRLALRHVKVEDEVIEEAIKDLNTNGFINYFGLQRFGSSRIAPTYTVGKAILSGDWKSAVELILKPKTGESGFKDVKEAQEIWWKTRNASEALVPLVRKDKSLEGKILMGLKKHGPNAYENAFDNLQRNMVTMYLHSYQSLIWNKIVSRRIREYGLKVLPGDLVLENPSKAEFLENMWQENAKKAKGSDDESDDDTDEEGGGRLPVRVLSEDEAQSASIYDIVYPLPGEDIAFPENDIGSWYTELLKEDGFSIDTFRKVNRKYGMYGTYRKMVEKAKDLNWRTLKYSDPNEDLLQSDFNLLKGKPPLQLDPEGPYKAVILEFSLKVCSYATMVVRELTKCETSPCSQATRTNQARDEDMANKKLKLEEEDQEDNHKSEADSIKGSSCTDEKHQESISEMEVEPSSKKEVISTLPQQEINLSEQQESNGTRTSGDTYDQTSKREAHADNMINKYLEANYH